MTSSAETIVLVTGASRGLGFAVAEALARPDTHIIAVARTVGGLEALDDRIKAAGGSATLVPLDIADEEAVARLGEAIAARWGVLHVLCHAATHAPPLSPTASISAKDFSLCHAVNVSGLRALVSATEPLLRLGKGRAVILDDQSGQKFQGAYASSKAAARQLTTIWAEECKRLGPAVEMYTPPPMPTALRARFYPGEDRDRLTPPEEAARTMIADLKL